jgi:hypothetical protein
MRLAKESFEKMIESLLSPLSPGLVREPNSDVTNLRDIEVLLASYPQAAAQDLGALREHRNHIAHGGRIGRESTFSNLDDVQSTLTQLLEVISNSTGKA